MLHYADAPPSMTQPYAAGCNIFVRGRLSTTHDDDEYFKVDLEQNGIDFDVNEIEVSVDIDSIIWTTRKLVCNNSIGVYLTPIYHCKPGIRKHNHVYVEVLIPQSEADQQAPGRRTEWLCKRFPMVAIPHTPIGQLSSSTGHLLRVYIFFPRMIHRCPHTGRRMNMMPRGVLDSFWEEILLPAISDSSTQSGTPYYSQSLEEAAYKQRGNSRSFKNIPLTNDTFLDVQERMQELILEQDDRSMYGSFFFVVEGKGIKLLTKDGQGVHLSPEIALRENISCLDWDHMLERKNGELLVDIGVSFTPISREPIVGLWRLDMLEDSYAAGGFNRGTMHHHCMLYNYGAMQAEMPQDRALQTHVAFRNTYNLYYEAVQPSNNNPVFLKDSDAYSLKKSYGKECFALVKIFRKVKHKTYGVRDEYRVSGQAAQVLLREIIPQVRKPFCAPSCTNIAHKARRYMRSKPVLWLPSRVWFEFLSRRVEEIQRTQIQLKHRNPPNLGIMTGILNHMLRCIITTPIIYDFHVRESMALLECRNVVAKAKMFFLHDLELNLVPCLDSIQESDDFRVLALMGLDSKGQRDRALAAQNRVVLERFNQTSMFPIGPNPTWGQLKKAVSANPVLMLKEWALPEQLRNPHAVLAQLFCKFTCQIWMMVASSAFKGVEPSATSLSDAMRCWTATSIDHALLYTTFKACNAGLEMDGTAPGCQGPRSASFSDRTSWYFPNPDHSAPRRDSDWSFFWSESGYITDYHKLLKEFSSEEDGFYIDDALATIFANLQCLPASQKATKKSKGHIWKVEKGSFVFITNPRFYKIESLGKEAKKTLENLGGRGLLKPRRVFQRALCQSDGFDGLASSKKDGIDRQRRRAQLEQLTIKTKNKRKPPQQDRVTSKPTELRPLTPEEEDDLATPLADLIGIYPRMHATDDTSDSMLQVVFQEDDELNEDEDEELDEVEDEDEEMDDIMDKD